MEAVLVAGEPEQLQSTAKVPLQGTKLINVQGPAMNWSPLQGWACLHPNVPLPATPKELKWLRRREKKTPNSRYYASYKEGLFLYFLLTVLLLVYSRINAAESKNKLNT